MSAKRLIVIDDEAGFCEYVASVAVDLGYDVRTCGSFREFEQLYDGFEPSIILLDMVMPDVDGIEIIKWLVGKQCTARIVVTTGYNPQYAKMASLFGTTKGIASVTTLGKPVRLADLRAALS
jgi:CheY-like chemotaxis protein